MYSSRKRKRVEVQYSGIMRLTRREGDGTGIKETEKRKEMCACACESDITVHEQDLLLVVDC